MLNTIRAKAPSGIRAKSPPGIDLDVRDGPVLADAPSAASERPADARADELKRFRNGIVIGASLIVASVIALFLFGVY